LTQDAVTLERTRYGELFEVRASLAGPNGKVLKVKTVWMEESIRKELDEVQGIPTSSTGKGYSREEASSGDLATIVDVHPKNGGEVGYSIEIFNAVGETIALTTLPESLLEELSGNEFLHARSLAG